MIQLQVRDRAATAWRKVHDFHAVSAEQISLVEHSRLAARLIDLSNDKVIARSLPARGIPVDKVPEGIIREAVLAFCKPEEVEQKTPDPNRKMAHRRVMPRDTHSAFARDGW